MGAPLWGFLYGPRSLICERVTGPRVSAVTFCAVYPFLCCLSPRSQSRGGAGRGASGLGYYREFSN